MHALFLTTWFTLMPTLILGASVPRAPNVQHGLYLLKRQVATNSTSSSPILPTIIGSSSGAATATASSTTRVISGSATSTSTAPTSSTSVTLYGCSARQTGNNATDSANLLTCQLNTMANGIYQHSECTPRGGGNQCTDLDSLNTPCLSATTNDAAAECVCTQSYYDAFKKCGDCAGVTSDTYANFTIACAGMQHPVENNAGSSNGTSGGTTGSGAGRVEAASLLTVLVGGVAVLGGLV
ncbi:hypothetical protein MNV49_001225 [Pseudohyphozyma bogoriensis]|nr:hypothetical protein MNV49_001225 [Pseudohyphozyma bogoriensis]